MVTDTHGGVYGEPRQGPRVLVAGPIWVAGWRPLSGDQVGAMVPAAAPAGAVFHRLPRVEAPSPVRRLAICRLHKASPTR